MTKCISFLDYRTMQTMSQDILVRRCHINNENNNAFISGIIIRSHRLTSNHSVICIAHRRSYTLTKFGNHRLLYAYVTNMHHVNVLYTIILINNNVRKNNLFPSISLSPHI